MTAILVGPPVWKGRGWLGRVAAFVSPAERCACRGRRSRRSTGPCTSEGGPGASARAWRRPGAQMGRVDPGILMRFTDLLETQVTTESGQALGRVHDLRAERTPRTLKITGLVVGPSGLLERSGSALRNRAPAYARTTSFHGRRSFAPTAARSSSGTTRGSGNRLRALPLYLTEAHIEKLLTPADALAAIEACFERQARGVIGTARAHALARATVRSRSCRPWTRNWDSPASSRTRPCLRARRSSSCSSTWPGPSSQR